MTSIDVEALRRRRREPTSAVRWRVSARYDGAAVPTTGTQFSPELSANVVHGEVELGYVLLLIPCGEHETSGGTEDNCSPALVTVVRIYPTRAAEQRGWVLTIIKF